MPPSGADDAPTDDDPTDRARIGSDGRGTQRSEHAPTDGQPAGLPLPPSPDGLPLLGNAHQVLRDPFGFYDRLFEHGDVVARADLRVLRARHASGAARAAPRGTRRRARRRLPRALVAGFATNCRLLLAAMRG